MQEDFCHSLVGSAIVRLPLEDKKVMELRWQPSIVCNKVSVKCSVVLRALRILLGLVSLQEVNEKHGKTSKRGNENVLKFKPLMTWLMLTADT